MMPYPSRVLMCPPDHFAVVDVKNPFMKGREGTVDKVLARGQWEAVRGAFEALGKPVSVVEAVPGLEDMVFCANQTLVGLGPKGERICLLSRMRHASREREVAAFEDWFGRNGYRVARLRGESSRFEGAGDALWHPGRRLIWGGYGFRSEAAAYAQVAEIFEAPVVLLKLVDERFYHLDTCFCPVDPDTVMIYPPAFDAAGLAVVRKEFGRVWEVSEPEALGFACNAAVVDGKAAVITPGLPGVRRRLAEAGLRAIETSTSEFEKSGGSVFCLKQFLF